MRILGHIHTFNDEEVIDRSLAALLGQTLPVEEVVIVDNGSKDGTLARSFPHNVTIIRHSENLGTSGAVLSGLKYALDRQYDWIWVFDADSAPYATALETLVRLYLDFPPPLQEKVWTLVAHRGGIVFSERGLQPVEPTDGRLLEECDASLWTGSLIRMAAVRKIGLPSPDYVLDMGEYAYGYQARLCGFTGFAYVGALMEHNIGGQNIPLRRYRIGPLSFRILDLPGIRSYYWVRNSLYFWLREYREMNAGLAFRIFRSLGFLTGSVLVLFFRNPRKGWTGMAACIRGWSDGLRGKMDRRY